MLSGSIRLFRFAGIDVFLHFSWFLAAAYFLSVRPQLYESGAFALYEYVGLFALVLLHEFGHAFACRQVGGIANAIMLWPLGGAAFVRPPARPGAELWSIAAGPLVNLMLIPVLELAKSYAATSGLTVTAPDSYRLIEAIRSINLLLLGFNLLPIYPLDGGQILRALLWFPLGPMRSLTIASTLGFVTIPLAAIYAFGRGADPIWVAILGFFLFSEAVAGWQRAKAMRAGVEPLA